MFVETFFILFTVMTKVFAQINGEFWWMNSNFTKLKGIVPSQPKFDDVSEFDTDESAKVIFRDNELENSKSSEHLTSIIEKNETNNITSAIKFQDISQLNFSEFLNVKNVNSTMASNHTNIIPQPDEYNFDAKDILDFKFPDENSDENIWDEKPIINLGNFNKPNIKKINDVKENVMPKPTLVVDEDNTVQFERDDEPSQSEYACTYMRKTDCLRCKGIPHLRLQKTYKQYKKHILLGTQTVCCVFPLQSPSPISRSTRIFFPDTPNTLSRKRRAAEKGASQALKQRDALMIRKFPSPPNIKPTITPTHAKITQKIVTPSDEYIDPYWNIKNANIRNKQSNNYQQGDATYDYSNQEYGDDHITELPRPGLVGLYSDNGQKHTTWQFLSKNKGFTYDDVVSEEDEDPGIPFGYGGIDPRLKDRVSTIPKPTRRRPQKITTGSSEDSMQTSESQALSYQAHPDFQVLQGFKLLNLVRNKNRFIRTTTTENGFDHESQSLSKPYDLVTNLDIEYDDFFENEDQVYKSCGKTMIDTLGDLACDKEMGDAESDSQPWLVVVVLTKSQQSILCYGTLVHPKAAITAADCVYGMSPAEISIIAGVWDLNEDTRMQHRFASVHIHEQYTPGQLSNSLAILHWKRPLRLETHVQPACLSDPHVGDSCIFVGWGGYDQAIHPRLRWQRASILTPRNCNDRLLKMDLDLPRDAFCATVNSRGTVTGVGGPLLCKSGRRLSVVGVAVWRDSVVVLLPVHQWVLASLNELSIQ